MTCIILDDEEQPRECTDWSANEIIRLRKIIAKLENTRKEEVPYRTDEVQL